MGHKAINWLAKLFTHIIDSGILPKTWKNAKIVAVLKPNKPAEDASNYRPISLLSCSFKLFERCLLGRIRPIIDNVIRKEQAGFQKNRNCCDQVLALTNFIELGFEANVKTGVVFLDLSAAYDTVWKRGLLMKLSQIIRCRKTLTLLTNILSDRSFQVTVNGKSSRKRILNNGLPQGSVLSCFLYCLYTNDLPCLQSRMFIYADDIAIAYQAKSFKELEDVMNKDMEKLAKYFENWRLKPNTTKTVHCIFHLNNRQASRKLNLQMNEKTIEYDKTPTYLGVVLDRSLTFRYHAEKTKTKLKSRVNLIQKLAGTTWGCSAKTLRITTQAMIMSVAEYCAPVWMNSVHTKMIDTQINVALRIICAAVESTPIPWLYVMSNITPSHLRREEAAIKECRKIENSDELPIFTDVMDAPINLRLKSRKPFWVFYRNANNISDLKSRWKQWWHDATVQNKQLVTDPTIELKGTEMPRRTWRIANRFRTGHGCCAYLLHKWKFKDSATCECGEVQTMVHIHQNCPIHRFNGSLEDIHELTTEARAWIENLKVEV